jgi:hypothetical protein
VKIKFHWRWRGVRGEEALQECFPPTDRALHNNTHHPAQRHRRALNHLFEMARCMLQHSKLGSGCARCPRLPTSSTVPTIVEWTRTGAGRQSSRPKEAWSGVRPSVKHVRVWIRLLRAVPDAGREQLDAKAQPGIFVGYGVKPDSCSSCRQAKSCVSHDVSFNEEPVRFRARQVQNRPLVVRRV